MSSTKALWGMFSVADHLRQRPFVADVLLYDRLVVPVPNDEEEIERWTKAERDPELQAELLDLLDDVVVRAPWNDQRRQIWAQRYGTAKTVDADLDASLRAGLAAAVEYDVTNVGVIRRNHSAPPPGPENPDDPAQLVSRQVLYDEFKTKRDRALLRGIPTVDAIDAVVAYGAYDDFVSDHGELVTEAGVPGDGEAGDRGVGHPSAVPDSPTSTHQRMPVLLFQWPFLAPNNPDRSDRDLLKEALELAHDDRIGEWRAAVQRWRANSILEGASEADSLKDMERLLEAYEAAAKKRKIQVVRQWACVAGAAVTGVAAVPFPPAGAAAAAFGAAAAVPAPKIPKRLEAAALFHEARRRFR